MALAAFAEPICFWFRHHFGEPTPAQRLAWPALAASKNLLLAAPTGGGKTLAAFVPILDRLFAAPFATSVRCLYVAPLKALVNDARRNLRTYLDEIRSLWPEASPSIRVASRTGDTPAHRRRELLLEPPDVLLTTPESLAVLLCQTTAADLFAGLRWVVVDELHALAPNKRGADLALSLERLTDLAGGALQRIGLSATSAPLDEAARYLVGADRPCAVGHVGDSAPLELTVEPLPETGRFLDNLLDRLQPELDANQTTLVFTNTRGLAERVLWALKRRRPTWLDQMAVHHSALAASRRREVERQMKEGRLRVVISSTSLELGIDIGPVDGVVLVHPPGGVIRLLQRVGRSGHSPGRTRRGLVLTSGPGELLEATVTAAGSHSGQVEPLCVPDHPFDVLCQQVLGMAAQRPWQPDEAFALVRRAYPFRALPRDDFDACLDYLSGRHRDGRDWLPARLCWFGDEFSIADERTARLLRRNLGTILGEEPRPVLVQDERGTRNDELPSVRSSFLVPCSLFRPVGQVEDAFADRLQPGDRFLLDGRCLEYRRRDGEALLVEEVPGKPVVPVWTSDGPPLAPELARRLYVLRLQAAEALREGPDALSALLRRDYNLGSQAAANLAAYFEGQECVSEIPDTKTCLIEVVGNDAGAAYYVHTPLNRAGNDALARAAVLRLARDRGHAAASVVADLGFVLLFRGLVAWLPEDFRRLLGATGFDADLTAALADSVTLRDRFRRVAFTGLMLLRNPLGRKRRVGGHDWAERRLFGQVRHAAPDFVLLRQAEREVRAECCDGETARTYACQLDQMTIRFRHLPQPSPFAEGWTQQAAGPAEMVTTPAEALRQLHAQLTRGADDREGTCRLAADA